MRGFSVRWKRNIAFPPHATIARVFIGRRIVNYATLSTCRLVRARARYNSLRPKFAGTNRYKIMYIFLNVTTESVAQLPKAVSISLYLSVCLSVSLFITMRTKCPIFIIYLHLPTLNRFTIVNYPASTKHLRGIRFAQVPTDNLLIDWKNWLVHTANCLPMFVDHILKPIEIHRSKILRIGLKIYINARFSIIVEISGLVSLTELSAMSSLVITRNDCRSPCLSHNNTFLTFPRLIPS